MPSIFGKTGSGRAKPGRKSIRGTISGPIPIPSTLGDEEFPIRNPESAKVSATADDEFPMRRPGTGIASPVPPEEPGASPEDQEEQSSERGRQEQQDPQSRDHENEQSSDSEREQAQEEARVATPAGAPASTGFLGGSRTDLARDTQPDPPSSPPPPPPAAPTVLTGSPASRAASRPASRSPPHRSSPPRGSPPGASPRTSPPARRATNPVLSTIRYSTISDSPSKQTTQSKDSPLRKKSTLRSAIGRLFGRGKRKNGTGHQDAGTGSGRESGHLSSAQHRSVCIYRLPIALVPEPIGAIVTDMRPNTGSNRSGSAHSAVAKALRLTSPQRIRSAAAIALDWAGRHHGH